MPSVYCAQFIARYVSPLWQPVPAAMAAFTPVG
jgi:hypothetical protein